MNNHIQFSRKVFLIDAYAMIYRAYYAFVKNPRINSKGFNTSAIFGFVNMLEDILKRETPEYIAVAFDSHGETFRHKVFEEYKAQRPKMPEDIQKSIPYIKEIVKNYGISIFEKEGFEADDIIGTLAKECQKEGFVVYMITPDKDYGQLVDDNIFQYKPKYGSNGFDILSTSDIKSKYRLKNTAQVIDLLGLMGDTSDNIPGCPGVGEKTAVKLLSEYESIENILENTSKLTGVIRTKIEENREQILSSKFLATIKTDVPIDFSVNQMQRQEADKSKIQEIFGELEFRAITARSVLNLPKTEVNTTPHHKQFSLFEQEEMGEIAPQKTDLNNIHNTEHRYTLIETDEQIEELLTELNSQKEICFDTETTSLNTFEAEIVGVSFAFKPFVAYYVPISADQNVAKQTLLRFKEVFENEHIAKIGQNIKYDMLVLNNYGVEVKGEIFDTMIAHYLLHPESTHNMDYMSEIYLNYRTIHFADLFLPETKELLKKKSKDINIREIDLLSLKDYACEDADITFRLKEVFMQKIKEDSLENLFYQIEMPLVKTIVKMELNGVILDDFAIKTTEELIKKELLRLERQIHDYSGSEVNISSPKQIGELLFERLRIDEKPKKTKTGQYQTDEDTLQKLKNRHPVINLILEYRGLKKLLNTYIEALPKLINQKTGKIHTSFNQTQVATGRLSSSNPNIQNIPIKDSFGKDIRKAFISDVNCVLISADYSQVELRIMAHLSGDENMIEAFLSGKDIHAATAAKIFKIEIEQVTPDMRRKAKTANFGIIYGISAFGLAERLNISVKEASMIINGYFNSFPQVKEYMEKSIETARQKGYAETLFGRKRYLADINSRNTNIRSFAERNAINAPIQGSAADIIKIAMINIDKAFTELNLRAEMILQVHDELVFNVPKNEVEQIKQIVKQKMENATKLNVPLIADIGIGNNWLEAH